jgi:hypothetical protein
MQVAVEYFVELPVAVFFFFLEFEIYFVQIACLCTKQRKDACQVCV